MDGDAILDGISREGLDRRGRRVLTARAITPVAASACSGCPVDRRRGGSSRDPRHADEVPFPALRPGLKICSGVHPSASRSTTKVRKGSISLRSALHAACATDRLRRRGAASGARSASLLRESSREHHGLRPADRFEPIAPIEWPAALRQDRYLLSFLIRRMRMAWHGGRFPKVLIVRADYQIGGGVALRLRTPAALKAVNCFGPELIAVAFDAFPIDRAPACDRPEPPRPSRVFQISSSDRIDGAGKDALPWQAVRMLAVWRAETIIASGYECLSGGLMKPWSAAPSQRSQLPKRRPSPAPHPCWRRD